MKRALLITAALAALVAVADEVRIGGTSGVNITTFNNAYDAGGSGPGAKLAFQVRDGGCTYYRAGCSVRADGGVNCVIDAGPGDPYICFANGSGGLLDPYKVDMPPGMDRLHFRCVDPAFTNQTDVYQRRP